MKIAIVIPTYNEKENISELIGKINSVLKNIDKSIIIVDDNSPDGTAKLVENLKQENVYVIKRQGKLGLASAYIEGFTRAINNGFDFIIQMDADFSHNPEYLPQMIEYLKDNDLVIGSRNIKNGKVKNWGIIRNLISKGGSLYSRLILNCPINDLTGGFNGWKKETLQKINLNKIISNGYCFQIEMKYRAFKNKAKIIEFPIIFEDRKLGKSKMNKKIFFEAFLNVIKIRFNKN